MRSHRIATGMIGLSLLSFGTTLQAELIIEETFTGYLDNELLSATPAGWALGLEGDWDLDPNDDFYVNKTEGNNDAGSGKAVYDRNLYYDGARTATRNTSAEHVLFEGDGDVFYASFLVDPARTDGDMLFELRLARLDGGGMQNLSFGITDEQYIVGNGGIDDNLAAGTVTTEEQMVVVRVEYGEAEFGPDDEEVVTLWVDPVDESSTPVINGLSDNILNRGGGRITAVSMRGGQMGGAPAFFDNLRVGSSFTAVAARRADFDRDGDVDGDDFLTWQSGFGINDSGDTDGDGDTDGNDFLTWQAQFGSSSGSASAAVPEPASMALVIAVVVVGLFPRGRECRRWLL